MLLSKSFLPTALKRYVVSVAVCSLCLATAQQLAARIIEPGLSMKIERANKSKQAPQSPTQLDDSEEPAENYYPAIIKLTNATDQLPEGVTELYRRDKLLLAYIPESLLAEIDEMGQVQRIEGGITNVPSLDRARQFAGYPNVETGHDLPQIYTGKGVVTGLVDIGFDPKHIAFNDPQTGTSRVKLITNYGNTPDDITRLTTPEEIAAWTTDNYNEWHATHVAGIMAGGYKGSPYYGIATEADIVASTSSLYNALLLAGMEDIIAYAKSVGKPAVINLSVSDATGPHDGTSLFCQYLHLLAEDATICISAGNDGIGRGYWSANFSQDGQATAQSVADMPSWSPAQVEGYIDVWSQDTTPLQFGILVYDWQAREIVYQQDFPEITADDPEVELSIDDFSSYLNGTVTIQTEINPENNRFRGLTYVNVKNNTLDDGSVSTQYIVALVVKGNAGQKMTAYASSSMRFGNIEGYPNLGYVGIDGSINDMVTGDGCIAVGAMTSRNTYPMLDGTEQSGSYTENTISGFSSYWSDCPTGKLPDVVAPGTYLISAISQPYLNNNSSTLSLCNAVSTVDGTDYYWRTACGTSMSSPFVAGVCALMLQANPDVTPSEIKETIISTLTTPTDKDNAQWGKGILNAYDSLQAILAKGAISSPKDNLLNNIQLPSIISTDQLLSLPFSFTLYNLQGQAVNPATTTPGLYIIRTATTASRILIR
jgi:subtilisin family serine protease